MPISLENTSNIRVTYNTGSSYIIETVKSDLYVRGTTSGDLSSEPTVISPTFTESVRTFIHSGETESQTTHTITIGQNTICDILIVGGGGGGGVGHGGGGGAGLLVFIHQTILNGTYTIKVGKGGNGAIGGTTNNNTPPTKGIDSEFGNSSINIIAHGGGASANSTLKNGGSGAGGDGHPNDGGVIDKGFKNTTVNTFPSGTVYSYGNDGGQGNTYGQGGGGGGAGAQGTYGDLSYSSPSSMKQTGSGGDGLSGISQIGYDFKTNFGNYGKLESDGKYWFAGGGGGGAWGEFSTGTFTPNGGTGGKGGGSRGGIYNKGVITYNPISAVNGTGSGGGGGAPLYGSGGNGGSGIVIIKFKTIVNAAILEGVTHKRLNFSYNYDNLVACYKFNNDYLDSSGNGHHLTNVGTVIQSTHIIEGQAVEFNSTDYLEFPATINPYTIWNGKGITFSCWIRYTATLENWTSLIHFQTELSNNTGIGFWIRTTPVSLSSVVAIYLRINSTIFQYGNSNTPLIANLNTWRHLVLCVGISGKIDVYIDNVRINGTETATIPNFTYNARYINRSSPSNGTWDGQMDDFRIYDRVLSVTDVASLYNKTYPIPTNTYTLTFPVRTLVDVNNNSNLILQGNYNVNVGHPKSSLLPDITNTTNRLIPLPTTNTSNISVRYHTLNPIKTTEGAQWTYSSTNPNVYHLGSVGIGTTSPEYSLDVRGFIYSSSGGYTSSALTKWSVLSDRRIKENIVKASYDKCLENVKNIELYNFNFKDNYVNTNDRHQLGFIAQEVQQIYPKAVEVSRMIMNLEEKIDDLLTLNTTQIDYTLYGSVKCLIQKLENIKIKMEQIKTVYNITT